MKPRKKRIRSKNMASTSSDRDHLIDEDTKADVNAHVNADADTNVDANSNADANANADVVDDFYYSALHDEDQIFPISDEKYAQELQLQEALISSFSHPNTSSPSKKYAPSSSKIKVEPSSSSIPETSSPPNKLKRKRPMVKDEPAAELPVSFCGICMDTKAPSQMFPNGKVCHHVFCSDCIRKHVSVKIKENITEVKCPDPDCEGVIGPELCRSIVPKEVLDRWEDALCESLILGTQKFYCPFKDCSAMLVDDGGEAVTSSECPNCNRLFCAQCKVAWHCGMDCNEFKNLKSDERNPEDMMAIQLAKNKEWRRCPNCKFFVEKLSGCNHISCRCGHQFCYRCGKKCDQNHACYVNSLSA